MWAAMQNNMEIRGLHRNEMLRNDFFLPHSWQQKNRIPITFRNVSQGQLSKNFYMIRYVIVLAITYHACELNKIVPKFNNDRQRLCSVGEFKQPSEKKPLSMQGTMW